MRARRRKVVGIDAVREALTSDAPVRLLLVEGSDDSPEARELMELARQRSVALWRGGPGDLRRMSPGPEPARALALVGADPRATLAQLLQRGGAVWHLHDVTYPSNAGFVVRTAEVSGADGVVIDGRFNHRQRSRLGHVSMGADRMLPVLWVPTETVLDEAQASGHRIFALEDAGDRTPWQADLTGAVLLLVGPERHGLPERLLERCHQVLRLPMAGFVPSYNLQTAVSAVALERLRQLEARSQ